jgi:hypothetical protein
MNSPRTSSAHTPPMQRMRRTAKPFVTSSPPPALQAVETFWEAAHDLAIVCGSRDATVLLPVDQFEELLSPSSGEMAAKFLRFLKACCEGPNRRLLLIGTMRSDYLDVYEHQESRLTAPPFHPCRLAPFPRERVGDVIVKPAERVHVQVAGDLVETLKRDTPTGDALPLLAFTLRELYRRGADDQRLEVSEYKDVGGMEGAIKKAAEKIIPKDSLPPDVEAAVRSSFVKYLAQVNDKDEFVRLTARWHDLPELARPILSRFIDERLLVESERDGQVLVEVAHEAMFRCWTCSETGFARLPTSCAGNGMSNVIKRVISKAAGDGTVYVPHNWRLLVTGPSTGVRNSTTLSAGGSSRASVGSGFGVALSLLWWSHSWLWPYGPHGGGERPPRRHKSPSAPWPLSWACSRNPLRSLAKSRRL